MALIGSSRGDAIDDFVTSINTKWSQQDYTGISQALSSRLTGDPNDVLALSIKAYFDLFATRDINDAHASAQSMFNVVNASNNAKAKELAQSIKDEVLSVPTSESSALTTDQKNQLHTVFPQLPMIKKCATLAHVFSGN